MFNMTPSMSTNIVLTLQNRPCCYHLTYSIYATCNHIFQNKSTKSNANYGVKNYQTWIETSCLSWLPCEQVHFNSLIFLEILFQFMPFFFFFFFPKKNFHATNNSFQQIPKPSNKEINRVFTHKQMIKMENYPSFISRVIFLENFFQIMPCCVFSWKTFPCSEQFISGNTQN